MNNATQPVAFFYPLNQLGKLHTIQPYSENRSTLEIHINRKTLKSMFTEPASMQVAENGTGVTAPTKTRKPPNFFKLLSYCFKYFSRIRV